MSGKLFSFCDENEYFLMRRKNNEIFSEKEDELSGRNASDAEIGGAVADLCRGGKQINLF